jgi:hypothetical protein
MVYCLSLLYIKELYFTVYFICKNNKSGFPVNNFFNFHNFVPSVILDFECLSTWNIFVSIIYFEHGQNV